MMLSSDAARASRAWIRTLRRHSQRKSASAPSSSARQARDLPTLAA
jgi:hypothetical protein